MKKHKKCHGHLRLRTDFVTILQIIILCFILIRHYARFSYEMSKHSVSVRKIKLEALSDTLQNELMRCVKRVHILGSILIESTYRSDNKSDMGGAK